MTVRSVLIVLNVLALLALAVVAARALRRKPGDVEKLPQNQRPFLSNEEMEGKKLERVLGWALFFAAVLAIALPLYWLREPTRQKESVAYYDNGSVSRGATLFANSSMPAYNSTLSLQCANCHGADGGGGAAPAVFTNPDGTAEAVQWKAPALNTVFKRFTPDEVTQIITYGRPGTPMQAWGVAGGGPKNDQSIADLVAYLQSIQISDAKAKQEEASQLADARKQPQQQLQAAQQAYDDAQKQLVSTLADASATAAQKKDARDAVTTAQQALTWAKEWASSRQGVTDGQILFENNCARCHTKGWSIFDPTTVDGTKVLGAAGGGGSLGFNLRDGGEARRFPGSKGVADQAAFVSSGSEFEKPYGDGGIGSGRMPGFGRMLTQRQITEIVQYERNGLDQHDPSTVHLSR